MKDIFKPGDSKNYKRTVSIEDIARFDTGTVHQLYSSFALGRDAEWCTRLFVLEMKEDDEEGIGTLLHIEHIAGAKPGSEILFTGIIEEITGNEIICYFEATHEGRLIARGKTGQKILKKTKLEELFSQL